MYAFSEKYENERWFLYPSYGVINGHRLEYMSRDMWFPTMWHFDKCRLRRACAAEALLIAHTTLLEMPCTWLNYVSSEYPTIKTRTSLLSSRRDSIMDRSVNLFIYNLTIQASKCRTKLWRWPDIAWRRVTSTLCYLWHSFVYRLIFDTLITLCYFVLWFSPLLWFDSLGEHIFQSIPVSMANNYR